MNRSNLPNEGLSKQTKILSSTLIFREAYKKIISSIKVLDPACGSGAFLNQAFDYLYREGQDVNRQIAELKKGQLDIFGLDKQILKNNLFGVDLNPESVEITKLSLWLKTANPKSELTSLDDNIRCGNSIIDDPLASGSLAFNWYEEFPEIIKSGGFNVVIGNPPYGADFSEEVIQTLKKTYKSFEYQINSYVIFYEKGLKLLKTGGYLGYITPATFTYQHYFNNLRTIFHQYKIVNICKYLYQVFEDADTGDTVSWIVKKERVIKNNYDLLVNICNKPDDALAQGLMKNISHILKPDGKYQIQTIDIDFQKIYSDTEPLGKIAQIIVGIKPYQKGKGVPKQTDEVVKAKPFTSDKPKDDSYRLCLIGKDFHRYRLLRKPTMYLSYGKWLAEPRAIAPFFEEKIIIRQTADSLIATIDKNNINLNNVYNVGRIDNKYNLKFILAIINSKLMNFIYQSITQEKGRLFAEVKKTYLDKLPIKKAPTKFEESIIVVADAILYLNDQFFRIVDKFTRFLKTSYSFAGFTNKISE